MSAVEVAAAGPFVHAVLGRRDYAIISGIVEPNTRVLDVGCGFGHLAWFLALEKPSLRYFGTADPSFYGINSEPVTEAESDRPLPKIYAVGIFYLEHLRWAPRYRPTALVGGSMLIYDMREAAR